nr:FGGY family carbohydrate kinase [uncultured Dongia sp.]
MAIVVFDIGKTNIKLSLVEAGEIRHTVSTPDRSLPAPPYPHIDEAGIWSFLLRGLKDLAAEAEITDIVVVAHGATAALVDAEGKLALPILDYEVPIEDSDYDRLASPFAETFSPAMAGGLNLGRQIHWLAQQYPNEFARVRYILPYPQYWSFRLSGIASSEVTYLGCHTGLWQPAAATFSGFVTRMGWRDLFPPLRRADEVLGNVLPEIRARTGLPADCRIRVGIHDSSASFLRHRLLRTSPFAVASTGTWVVCMAAGADVANLPAARSCLANVDVMGNPVPVSLFMGGREYSTLTEGANAAVAGVPDAAAVIDAGAMLVPPISDFGGPFVGKAHGGARGTGLRKQEQVVAQASLYLALMTDYCLDLIKATGPVVVEGSLIGNDLYLSALAALRRSADVFVSDDATGTISGAAQLAGQKIDGSSRTVTPLDLPMTQYRQRWREALPA